MTTERWPKVGEVWYSRRDEDWTQIIEVINGGVRVTGFGNDDVIEWTWDEWDRWVREEKAVNVTVMIKALVLADENDQTPDRPVPGIRIVTDGVKFRLPPGAELYDFSQREPQKVEPEARTKPDESGNWHEFANYCDGPPLPAACSLKLDRPVSCTSDEVATAELDFNAEGVITGGRVFKGGQLVAFLVRDQN